MDQLKFSTASATGNPRNKVALKQGRSLMDWIRLTNSGVDLTGTGGKLRDVSLEELSRHNKRHDAWLAIRGLVYNVTEYFEYHPGGEEELLRGIGIDATDLFDQVHKWVNYDSMLKKCLVGRLKTEISVPVKAPSRLVSNGGSFLSPPPPPPKLQPEVTSDWMQTSASVTIIFYTRQKGLDRNRVSAALETSRCVRLRIYFVDKRCYDYAVRLSHDVDIKYSVTVSSMTGKVELTLPKLVSNQWQSLGVVDTKVTRVASRIEAAPFIRKARLSRKIQVTHNVHLFSFTFPPGHIFHVPLGHHVQMKLTLKDGSEKTRSYTPVLSDFNNESDECPHVEDDQSRTLHFLIKIYPEGPFTSRLDQLKEGDEIQVSEPTGSFNSVDWQPESTDLVAIAAGTGITPMIRLIFHALKNNRQVSLLFCNRTADDVIWDKELLDLRTRYPDKLVIWHVLSEPEEEWAGFRGRINSSIISSTIHPSSDGNRLISICGPTDFNLDTARLLDDAGYTNDKIHIFSA